MMKGCLIKMNSVNFYHKNYTKQSTGATTNEDTEKKTLVTHMTEMEIKYYMLSMWYLAPISVLWATTFFRITNMILHTYKAHRNNKV